MGILTKILGGGGISKVVDSIANGLDGLITTKEERLQLQIELEEVFINDRDSARQMYKDDNKLQKWYAMSFLIAYFLLTVGMLVMVYFLALDDLKVPDWAIAFLSTIWGAMSSKVSTITDFLFGGSKSTEQEKNFKLKR